MLIIDASNNVIDMNSLKPSFSTFYGPNTTGMSYHTIPLNLDMRRIKRDIDISEALFERTNAAYENILEKYLEALDEEIALHSREQQIFHLMNELHINDSYATELDVITNKETIIPEASNKLCTSIRSTNERIQPLIKREVVKELTNNSNVELYLVSEIIEFVRATANSKCLSGTHLIRNKLNIGTDTFILSETNNAYTKPSAFFIAIIKYLQKSINKIKFQIKSLRRKLTIPHRLDIRILLRSIIRILKITTDDGKNGDNGISFIQVLKEITSLILKNYHEPTTARYIINY